MRLRLQQQRAKIGALRQLDQLLLDPHAAGGQRIGGPALVVGGRLQRAGRAIVRSVGNVVERDPLERHHAKSVLQPVAGAGRHRSQREQRRLAGFERHDGKRRRRQHGGQRRQIVGRHHAKRDAREAQLLQPRGVDAGAAEPFRVRENRTGRRGAFARRRAQTPLGFDLGLDRLDGDLEILPFEIEVADFRGGERADRIGKRDLQPFAQRGGYGERDRERQPAARACRPVQHRWWRSGRAQCQSDAEGPAPQCVWPRAPPRDWAPESACAPSERSAAWLRLPARWPTARARAHSRARRRPPIRRARQDRALLPP